MSYLKKSKYAEDVPFIYAELNAGKQPTEIARLLCAKYGVSVDAVRTFIKNNKLAILSDGELIESNVKLKKTVQKTQDLNRIERKSFRHHARIENAVSEYYKELAALVKKEGLKIKTTKHKKNKTKKVIGLQLSDLHFNELVDLPHNKYDFEVAAKRLEKLANEVIFYGNAHDCNILHIAILGDLLNSDRRLDEMLSMATNRAKATQIAVRLLASFIKHLNDWFNITLAGVTGNESRSKKELSWSDIAATDNYDFNIYDTLKILFENKDGIHFEEMEANEKIIQIGKLKILLLHGHQIGRDTQKSTQQIIGKYSTMGHKINYIWAGHIHCTHIGDYFQRNSSLVGDNAYSNQALNYVSRAAQNLHIIEQDGSMTSMKIDLQNTTNEKGYNIESIIEAYNAKSATKADHDNNDNIILKIVI